MKFQVVPTITIALLSLLSIVSCSRRPPQSRKSKSIKTTISQNHNSVYPSHVIQMCNKLANLEHCFLGKFYQSNLEFKSEQEYWIGAFRPYSKFNYLTTFNDYSYLRKIIIEVKEIYHPIDKSKPYYPDNERVEELKEQMRTANNFHNVVITYGKLLESFPGCYIEAQSSWFHKHTLNSHLGNLNTFEYPTILKTTVEQEKWDDIYLKFDSFINSIKTSDNALKKIGQVNEHKVMQAITAAKMRQELLHKATKGMVSWLNDEIALVRSLTLEKERKQFRASVVQRIIALGYNS